MFSWLKTKALTQDKPKTLGQIGEQLAQEDYKKRGFDIIAANFFNRKGKRLGEIDFIANNHSKIVFVEVKTRTGGSGKFGQGPEAVDIYKQNKILKAVKIFLLRNQKYRSLQPQIDVCLVKFNGVDKNSYSVTILPNAVEDWN